LTAKVSEYYTALAKNDGTAEDIYTELMAIFDGYIEKYPELTNVFATLIGSIRTADSAQSAFNVTLQTLSEMLSKTGGAYDALSGAMKDMQEIGALTADTIQTITEDFPELIKYLEETADGFTVADDAMSNFLADVRANYLNDVNKAKAAYESAYQSYETSDVKTEEGRQAVENARQSLQNAIDNANNWLRSEATLTRSSIFEEYTNLLKEQQDAIEEEYDAYKELCDLRKELLQTYQDELDYKRKLKSAQDNATRLSTQLAVSRLDTSAAGQARTRELESSLKQAEEELEDITLEHAIEMLENQLDSQLSQYEGFIQSQIQSIEQTIQNAVSMSTESLIAAFEAAGGQASTTGPADSGTANDGTSVSTDNTSYSTTVNNAQSYLNSNSTISEANVSNDVEENPFTYVKSKLHKNSSKIKNKTGDDFRLVIGGKTYHLEVGSGRLSEAERGQANKAVTDANSGTFVSGSVVVKDNTAFVRASDGTWVSVRKRNKSRADDWKSFKTAVGIYHSGGFVGGVNELNVNEEFAKLLKGEFVSTPTQMKRFMEDTLPKIANYSATGSTNEFNAPLIEITCESVTSESLPQFEKIVNDAVKEIQKQLDSGMSRAGFKRPVAKRLNNLG
jgi:hypothetical protein